MERVLLRGGYVHTPQDPYATAMAIGPGPNGDGPNSGGIVAWVGDDASAAGWAADADRIIELEGRLVTPAFVDAHVHLAQTGLASRSVDLSGARSAADLLTLVSVHVRARPHDTVVLGSGWDETTWSDPRLPTPAELHSACRGRAAYLARVDAHSALVTGSVVDVVRNRESEQPTTGPVTGVGHDAARRAAHAAVPASERRAAIQASLQTAAAAGIACVHEMAAPHIGPIDDLVAIAELGSDPGVTEVVPYWGSMTDLDRAARLGCLGAAGDLCADGSVGSRTAALAEPYEGMGADASGARGQLRLGEDDVREHVIACTRAGLQAGFHCIGDRAVRTVVHGFAGAATELGDHALIAQRHRLEHVEMIDDSSAAVLARLGVVASVQPIFDARWGGSDGMYAQRLGAQRAARMNPWRPMARAGVALAFGSDSPVTPFDPWAAVQAAVRHHEPSHRMTARAAFTAHTRGGWRAARRDDAGVLTPGAPATYAVWDVEGELVVQTPDDRVSAWSTDPRAGVPGLPDLSSGARLPRCVQTVRDGIPIFNAHSDW